MSAEDVLYTERLRKSQADGIFALRHRAHDIAREIEADYRRYYESYGQPDATAPGWLIPEHIETNGPIRTGDLAALDAWSDGVLSGMFEGVPDTFGLREFRDEVRALIRWIREDGREAAGPTPWLVPATSSVCAACGHVHAGPQLGGICIGCPCPEDGRA